MADTYDVDIGDAGADYARGVAYPSSSELSVAAQGINSVSKGLFSVLGSMQSSSKATDTSINRELYKGFVSDIQLLRGQTGLGLRSGVTAAISKWSAQGLKVNEEVSKYVKTTTGIDLDYLNANPEQEMLNKVSEQLAENPAYPLLAKDNLIASGNENPSEQEVLIEAARMIAEQEAAALLISNANTLSAAEFVKQEPFWINTLDRTRELGVKALAIELAGGNASAETIEKFRANVFLLEQNYVQPRGVSDDEFKGVRRRLDGLKEMVDFISGYDTRVLEKLKIDTLNNVDLAIINQMKAADLDPTLQRAILGNLEHLSEFLLGQKHSEVLQFLQNIPVDNINYENIEIPLEGIDKLTEITDDPNADVSQNTLNTEDELFLEVEIQKATELNNRTRGAKSVQSLIDYSLTFEVLALDPKALEQDENARKLFLKGIGRTSLLMSKSSSFIDRQMFDPTTGLFSNKTFDLLEKIKVYDPSGYELAVAQLKHVLQKQSQVFITQSSGELQSSFFRMTGLGEIEYDLERKLDTGQIRMDKRILPLLNNYATIHYNGNVTEMIADSGKRLSTFERSQLDNLGFKIRDIYLQDYREIETVSKMYKRYVKNMERLGMDTTMIEQTLIKGVDVKEAGSFGSLQNPYPIQWSNETETDELLFMSIEKGDHYIDINGDVRVKN